MPVRDAVQGFRQAICVTVRGPAGAPPGSPDQAMITGAPARGSGRAARVRRRIRRPGRTGIRTGGAGITGGPGGRSDDGHGKRVGLQGTEGLRGLGGVGGLGGLRGRWSLRRRGRGSRGAVPRRAAARSGSRPPAPPPRRIAPPGPSRHRRVGRRAGRPRHRVRAGRRPRGADRTAADADHPARRPLPPRAPNRRPRPRRRSRAPCRRPALRRPPPALPPRPPGRFRSRVPRRLPRADADRVGERPRTGTPGPSPSDRPLRAQPHRLLRLRHRRLRAIVPGQTRPRDHRQDRRDDLEAAAGHDPDADRRGAPAADRTPPWPHRTSAA